MSIHKAKSICASIIFFAILLVCAEDTAEILNKFEPVVPDEETSTKLKGEEGEKRESFATPCNVNEAMERKKSGQYDVSLYAFNLCHRHLMELLEKGSRLTLQEAYFLGIVTFHLGEHYEKGLGVPQDFHQAVKYLTISAENQNVDGLNLLGWLTHNGNGVVEDRKKAAELWEKAAKLGYSDGMVNFGWVLENGDGVEKNITQAMVWFSQAARKMHPRGIYNLAYNLPKNQDAMRFVLFFISGVLSLPDGVSVAGTYFDNINGIPSVPFDRLVGRALMCVAMQDGFADAGRYVNNTYCQDEKSVERITQLYRETRSKSSVPMLSDLNNVLNVLDGKIGEVGSDARITPQLQEKFADWISEAFVPVGTMKFMVTLLSAAEKMRTADASPPAPPLAPFQLFWMFHVADVYSFFSGVVNGVMLITFPLFVFFFLRD